LDKYPTNGGKQGRKRNLRWGYWALLAAILAASSMAYLAWWSNFRSLRPEFSIAEPFSIHEKTQTRVALLWSETVLASPVDGAVHYPQGEEAVRVAKNEAVAEVVSGGRKAVVLAPQSGYFLPGVDGLEGRWNFSDLWPGDGQLPDAAKFRRIPEGSRLRKGEPLGKILPQPQELRAIAYVEADEAVKKQVEGGMLHFALPGERPQRARVRAVQDFGPKVKAYLSLPFFPPEISFSRETEFEFFQGEKKGVVLPESAILQKEGKLGVFAFVSGKLEVRPVLGQPLPGARFLVIEGLRPGDLVLTRAEAGAERKVLLW
jgi:hypothetical protein